MSRPRQSRRSFLRGSAVAAGAVAGIRLWAPTCFGAPAAGDKLRVAVIGCGGQGRGAHIPPAAREKLVAIVDPDPKCRNLALKAATDKVKGFDGADVKQFDDYRKLFDAMAKGLDAVLVATPNHHHALPALIAMKHGIAAYVEKPMCYSMAEARQMAQFAREYKVATQMGNQGHSGEGYRRLVEFIQAGAIGNVTEVYHWCNRANGGFGGRLPTIPVPEGMNWDTWIGPAPMRDYHKDLHPHEWHGWHDFGNGSLGNMGCHIMDGAHWALKLGHPSVIECEEMIGGSDERYPVGARIRWEYPAREGLPPVKVWWYDGRSRAAKDVAQGDTPDAVDPKSANLPPIARRLAAQHKQQFDSNGTIYVGDKGILCSGTYGGGVAFVPAERIKAYTQPDKSIPRVKGGHHGDFFNGVRGEGKPCSNFEVAAPFTEIILLGCLAMKAGVGKKLEWDGKAMRVTNNNDMNKFIDRQNRQGWTV